MISRKSQVQNEIVADEMQQRVVINGETAIKPYYYFRNGLLHVRYTVDRCVELSKDESTKIKCDLTASAFDKQNILARAWSFFTDCVGKKIITDGIEASYNMIKGRSNGYKN